MAITFPLSTAEFADRLVSVGFRWQLQRYFVTTGTAGGDIITNETARPKWVAPVPLEPMLQTTAASIQSTIEAIEGAGADGKFHLYDLRKAGAQRDRRGTTIGSRVVTITAKGGDNTHFAVANLPSNYLLIRGDHCSVNLDGGDRSYHRIVETVQATSNGVADISVVPPMKVNVAVGQRVVFYKPACRCIIQPGSFNPGQPDGRFVSGMFFNAIEN